MIRSAPMRLIAVSSATLLLLAASIAAAQTATSTAALHVPEYRSVFDGYKSYRDEPGSSWRDANDNVGRIGGWRAYAREMHQSEPPAPAPVPPRGSAPSSGARAPTPEPAGGEAHRGHTGGVR